MNQMFLLQPKFYRKKSEDIRKNELLYRSIKSQLNESGYAVVPALFNVYILDANKVETKTLPDGITKIYIKEDKSGD